MAPLTIIVAERLVLVLAPSGHHAADQTQDDEDGEQTDRGDEPSLGDELRLERGLGRAGRGRPVQQARLHLEADGRGVRPHPGPGEGGQPHRVDDGSGQVAQ
jgi:hypothetical protein